MQPVRLHCSPPFFTLTTPPHHLSSTISQKLGNPRQLFCTAPFARQLQHDEAPGRSLPPAPRLKQPREVELCRCHLTLHDLEPRLVQSLLDVVLLMQVRSRCL